MRWRDVTTQALFLCILALSGCAPSANPAPLPAPTQKRAIPVGIVTSLSGSLAKFGEAHVQGYKLALEEINAAGGVLGQPLELVVEDDGSVPTAAATAIEKLAQQSDLPLILGAYSSSATMLAAGMAERHQVPLLVPTAAVDEITNQGYRWIFRINAPSHVFIETLLDFMDGIERPARLAVVFENTAFGTSVAESAQRQARMRGIALVAYQTYETGTQDFKPLLTLVQTAQPDVVLFVSYLDDAVLLMQHSQAVDLNPRLFAGAGAGFSLPDFPRLAGRAAEYTISVTQWTEDVQWQGASAFARKFEAKYGSVPQYHSAQAYTALRVAADALTRARTTDRAAVRRALETTNLDSLFGKIQFDKNGQNQHPMLVTQIVNGKFVTVYPPEAASRTVIYPIPKWRERAASSLGNAP